MAIDVDRARAETPGCRHVNHLNNAGAALMPQVVVDAQIDHLRLEAEIGGYEARAEAAERIDGAYAAIARMLGCSTEEVALVENATVAWDMAFHALDFRPGDRILTAEAEYVSNYLAYLKAAKDKGVSVEVVPSDGAGQLSVPALAGMIDDRVKLIAVTHVPTNGGLVNPAAEIGQVAKQSGAPYLLDACQSVGQMPLDVEELGCDLLSATGRKYLRGPRGSGFLYARKGFLETLEPPFIDLHAATWTAPDRYILRPDARRFENWEFNYAAVIGLGVAVDYALAWGLAEIEARVNALAARLRALLANDLGLPVYDIGARKCGIVTTALPGHSAETVKSALRAQAINVSVTDVPSMQIDAQKRGLPELVRASVHYYNTEDELDRFCAALEKLIRS